MKCAVAIVLALIGLSLAYPAPSGLGGLAFAPVEARSSYINHGITIPRVSSIVLTPIKPLIQPIVKVPIVSVVKPLWA